MGHIRDDFLSRSAELTHEEQGWHVHEENQCRLLLNPCITDADLPLDDFDSHGCIGGSNLFLCDMG